MNRIRFTPLTPRVFRGETRVYQALAKGLDVLDRIVPGQNPKIKGARDWFIRQGQILRTQLGLNPDKALLKAVQKYRDLFQKAPIGFHNIAPDGRIIEVNEKWLEIMGYSTAEEVIGRKIFEFIVPEQKDNARARFEARLAGRPLPQQQGDRQYLRRDGSRVFVKTYDTIINNGLDHPTYVQTSFLDLTELRQAQAARTQVETQQREMAAAALAINSLIHALSQKFTFLMGYVDLSLRRPEKNYGTKISTAAEQIRAYFNLFNLFRCEITSDEPVNLPALANGVFQRVRERFSAQHIQAELYVGEKLKQIKSSGAALEVIFEALLNNAFEAIQDSGQVTMIIRQDKLGASPALEILVIDNGCGITPEVQQRMFVPFFSTNPDAVPLQKGLSLGLVRHAVDRLSGEIRVVSAPGQGARFTILLPLEEG